MNIFCGHLYWRAFRATIRTGKQRIIVLTPRRVRSVMLKSRAVDV